MYRYILATLLLASFGPFINQVHAEQRFIGEITGPYQSYSGQPLVDLGGRYYFFEGTQKFNWDEAFLFCRNLSLLLVSIEDEIENELIKTHILDTYGTVSFWTSGSDASVEGTFVWVSTGKPLTFTDWHAGEPSSSHGGEDCIAFQLATGLYKWNDYRNIENLYAICEQE